MVLRSGEGKPDWYEKSGDPNVKNFYMRNVMFHTVARSVVESTGLKMSKKAEHSELYLLYICTACTCVPMWLMVATGC
jgi:hypothetical protein